MHVLNGYFFSGSVGSFMRNLYKITGYVNCSDKVRRMSGRGATHRKTMPLPYRIERGSFVLPYFFSVDINDRPRLNLNESCEKIPHRDITDETEALAIGFCRDGQPKPARLRAYLRLREFAHREKRMRKVVLLELVKKV